jgi:hypothetical protein
MPCCVECPWGTGLIWCQSTSYRGQTHRADGAWPWWVRFHLWEMARTIEWEPPECTHTIADKSFLNRTIIFLSFVETMTCVCNRQVFTYLSMWQHCPCSVIQCVMVSTDSFEKSGYCTIGCDISFCFNVWNAISWLSSHTHIYIASLFSTSCDGAAILHNWGTNFL